MSEQDNRKRVDDHRGVTEEEIRAAMSVNSVPDEVRTHSDFADETGQVMDFEGNLGRPVDPHTSPDERRPVQTPDGT